MSSDGCQVASVGCGVLVKSVADNIMSSAGCRRVPVPKGSGAVVPTGAGAMFNVTAPGSPAPG